MKICFVSDQSFPPVGGEGVSTQEFALSLSQRGHKIVVLTSRVKNPPSYNRGIKIYRFFSLSIPGQRGPLAFPSFSKVLKILKRENPQILHITLPSLLGWQALRGGEKLGIPRVMGFHVQLENVLAFGLYRFLGGKFLKRWFSYLYQKPQILIAPTSFARTLLKKYTSKPIVVISNGVKLKEFRKPKITEKSLKEKYGLPETAPLLISVGRLSPEKNPEFLLQIASFLKERREEFRLLIVGRGKLYSKLRRMVKKFALEDRVILTGWLEREELISLFVLADIFVLSSRVELEGIGTLEAMASKCALLIGRSPSSAASLLVEEGKNGYTFGLDTPREAGKKISYLLHHPEVLKKMKEASYLKGRDYQRERSVKKLESLYLELIKR